MKRDVREKRYKLYRESKKLREIAQKEKDFDKARHLHNEQTKLYKKWEFLKGLGVAMDKVGKDR